MKRKSWIIVVLLLGIVVILGFISLKSRSLSNYEQKTTEVVNEEPVNNEAEVLLTSPYIQLALYEEAFASALATEAEKQIVLAGITSHHFLAKSFIAEFFQGIDNQNIKQIILISPDHFNYTIHEQTLAYSTPLNWQTPFSVLYSDQNFIEKLSQESLITLSNTAFRNEHGIYTLIPFIKHSFPKATILPLILNPKKNDSDFFNFGQIIKQELDSTATLLIVSSDFSHNLSLEKTQQADLQSIEALKQLSLDNLDLVNCDCHGCLAFLLGYLADENYQFELVDNKSSADFSEETQETVTSYVGGYFLP